MAKAFYSMEEVCELLGKTEDEVKELVREGTLREFRDAGKIFFRAEQIHKLAGTEAPSDDSGEIMLEPVADEAPAGDEAELPTLADSDGTSVLGLEPLDETPASPPPPPAEAKSAEKDKGTVISASGIGVFDDDELEIDADPMAETQITASPGDDALALEGTGSGSGLLDLTHEPDDTKLGAELLDEIYPGEEDVAAAPIATAEPEEEIEEAEEEPEEAVEEAVPAAAAEVMAPAAYVVAGDPSEGLFSGLLVGAILLLALAGSVVASSLQGFFPDYAEFLTNQFWIFLGGAAGLVVITLLLGWVIGKAGAPRKA